MSTEIPQHSTFSLKFENITYSSTSAVVNLGDIDDFVIAIVNPRITDTPDLQLKYSLNPSRFIIDAANNTVEVTIIEPAIIDTVGKFFLNLWLIEGSTATTHLTQTFKIVKSVDYN